MKKLVIICKESILSGYIKTGLSEIPDSLANSLNKDYEVSLICIDNPISLARNVSIIRKYNDNITHFKFSKVHYYLIKEEMWYEECVNLLNSIQAEIIHNFAEPELINHLTYNPLTTIYTFVNINEIKTKTEAVSAYTKVTATSQTYKNVLLRQRDTTSEFLRTQNFNGMNHGLLTQIFTPNKGFLLPSPYSVNNLRGKELCKKKLLKMYGIEGNPCIYFSGGLIKESNLDQIIEAIPEIQKNNGLLVIANKSDVLYADKLKKYSVKDGVLYFERYPSLVQIPLLVSSADFYIQPQSETMGTLMPLIASNYGTIPILSLVNGTVIDNFSDENAIIIETSLRDTISKTIELYNDPTTLIEKRKTCMNSVPSWDEIRKNYITLYEE